MAWSLNSQLSTLRLMFQRLVFDHTVLTIALVAFLTSATIFVAFFWKAMRMQRPKVDRFAQLPFQTETPAARHDD